MAELNAGTDGVFVFLAGVSIKVLFDSRRVGHFIVFVIVSPLQKQLR